VARIVGDSGAFDVTSLQTSAPESPGLRTSGVAVADGLQGLAAENRCRHRVGTFEPVVVRKRQRRLTGSMRWLRR
jgi:hypothetical protein